MSIALTNIEVKKLKILHKQIKNQKTCDRIKAILLLHKGLSAFEISEILLIDEDTVRNWKRRFQEKLNFTSWLQDNYRSRTCDLSEDKIELVKEYLRENIISDSKQVINFIDEQFKIKYSTAGIVSLLHRIGYEYKNTTLIPSKLNPEAQKDFKNKFEKLSNELKSNEVILFGDGVHPQHNTVCSKAWIKKGTRKEIKSNTGRSRVNIHGAYNSQNQDIIIHDDITLNTENTKNFFRKIESFYKNKSKIYLILDNAKYYKNKEITKYIENSRLEILYLPPYSPNLNLIERLWKFMRKMVINNKYYEKFSVFKNTILDFFKNSKKYKEIIASFIGYKMQLI